MSNKLKATDINKIVNKLIAEAFNNHAKPEFDLDMLTGGWYGSEAFATVKLNPSFDKVPQIGINALVVGKKLVEGSLEDSPSAIFTDPTSFGYFMRELEENGYEEIVEVVATCDEEDIPAIFAKIVEYLADENQEELLELAESWSNALSDITEDDEVEGSESKGDDFFSE